VIRNSNDPVAADANIKLVTSGSLPHRAGTKTSRHQQRPNCIPGFLFRYPTRKAAQARANLQQLEHKATSSSFDVARYYDKQKAYRAAVIYYNEVIRQQPGSVEAKSEKTDRSIAAKAR